VSAPQPPAQHDDPFGEARTHLLQALAVAATVGEAGARWVAVGIQNRAAAAERVATADQTAAALRRHADRLDGGTGPPDDERWLIERAFGQWLDKADLVDTARLWRTAAVHAAAGNPRAAEAMARAEARLARMHPDLVNAYRRYCGAGRPPAEAMKAAAYAVWEAEARAHPGPAARPHGGPVAQPLRAGADGRALPPGGPALDDLDAAVRAEAGRLAAHVSPEALDTLQRQWRAAGRAPAADAAGLLAQYARDASAAGHISAAAADHLAASVRQAATAEPGDDAAARHLTGYAEQQRRAGTLDYGAPDLAHTAVDEHDAGLTTGRVRHGAAEHDAAGAAQRRRMGQAFPPLTQVGLDPAVAAKRPATVVPNRSPRQGRTR